jgi:hypothetical protein
MKQDQENFDPLLRLLALKRHEQPPPGYFNVLPAQIRARLEAPPEESLFSSLVRLFSERIKPALAYSFVLSVCAVMAYAMNSFLHLEAQPALAAQISPPASGSASALNLEASEGDRLSAALLGGSDQTSNMPVSASPLLFLPVQPALFHPDHN